MRWATTRPHAIEQQDACRLPALAKRRLSDEDTRSYTAGPRSIFFQKT